MLISKANALSASGQKDEAVELYGKVVDDASASDAQRKRAEEALAAPARHHPLFNCLTPAKKGIRDIGFQLWS
jgi:hypothetical protein